MTQMSDRNLIYFDPFAPSNLEMPNYPVSYISSMRKTCLNSFCHCGSINAYEL
jgi:hypothetical protein